MGNNETSDPVVVAIRRAAKELGLPIESQWPLRRYSSGRIGGDMQVRDIIAGFQFSEDELVASMEAGLVEIIHGDWIRINVDEVRND